jgi:hypothetical protein
MTFASWPDIDRAHYVDYQPLKRWPAMLLLGCTEAEWFEAHRRVVSDEDARDLARGIDVGHAGAIGVSYSPTSLQLLALLSPQVEAKVNAYRHAMYGGTIPEEQERLWQEGLEQTKELLVAVADHRGS